ncbi:unnamed protein product [Orchesella dallaii]|uniref:FAD/NAD(P)-binding domain-containing protein n=1 Tax=Orchesella dallaii TaxID=48710 RepID=A0ABP1QNK1_9HEXA
MSCQKLLLCEVHSLSRRFPSVQNIRKFSSKRCNGNRRFKLVVIGGGAGGCSIAAKFAKTIGPKSIAVIEPSDVHYYQPMWTLVGGGMKSLADSGRPMSSVLPSSIEWVKDQATEIKPSKHTVVVGTGSSKQEIQYDYLVIAVGIQLQYEKIKGLPQAFNSPGVCSNYSSLYVNKTLQALKDFNKGNAVFTFPNTPVKCAGAPQKILYIADQFLRKNGKRDNAKLIYNTSLGVLFGVKHYADSLWNVVKSRDISVNLRRNLVEVNARNKTAIFEDLDNAGKLETVSYEMLHVTPPMGAYDLIKKNSEDIPDAAGFVDVNKGTLQHVRHPNVFAIGDCANLPTAKTAAAVAGENGILFRNLTNVMNGKEPELIYDGYTSCPLVTGYDKCILAEFDYNGQPLETFPIDQSKERRSMFLMKKDVMPEIYWNLMLKGNWNGPAPFRKLFAPFK